MIVLFDGYLLTVLLSIRLFNAIIAKLQKYELISRFTYFYRRSIEDLMMI